MMPGIVLFGLEIPFWAIILIAIVVAIVLWKLIKFTLVILLFFIIFFIILAALDYFSVFDRAKDMFSILIR